MTAPSTDVQSNSAIDGFDFDPVAAFFDNLAPGATDTPHQKDDEKEEREEPSQKAVEAPAKDKATETPEEADEATTEEPEAPETPAQRRDAADDDEVVVQVGDEAKRVSVKDLKRLFGQEASLTQKSQQVAETRRALDQEQVRYQEGLGRMAQEASKRWEEYQKIDFLLVKDAMAPEAYTKLREDAQAAYQLHQFYGQEAGAYQQAFQQQRQQVLREQAQSALKQINDPASKVHIPDWSDRTYDSLREFAVSLGAPLEAVNSITDPWAIKALHLAQQQAQAAKDIAQVTTKPRPVVKAAPSKTLTSREAPETNSGTKADRRSRSLDRLSRTGEVEDAANAFLAGWEVQ